MANADFLSRSLCLGVDVGGTNTDAIILLDKNVVSWHKSITTNDITTGVMQVINGALRKLPEDKKHYAMKRICIGTTHFINAIIQRKNLAKVAVIRLCGLASLSLRPFVDFPDDIANEVNGGVYMVSGGYQFNGSIISEIDEKEIKTVVGKIHASGINNIVVSGIFSPVKPDQEDKVATWIRKYMDSVSITCSHTIGYMGLLERENASIINETLKPLCKETITGLDHAIKGLGLTCPFYLTQNDGTLISSSQCIDCPVKTFTSGPTNSMRGATFLSGLKDAIVVDIGGTTSDIGMLIKGFPRPSSTRVTVGGVITNFQMPDVLSIGLGGGSHVVFKDNQVTVGPKSVGYELDRSKAFGGSTTTACDVAIAAGHITDFGKKELVKDIQENQIDITMDKMVSMLEDAVDTIKTSKDDQPLILVGGGSAILDPMRSFNGVSEVIRPKFFQVANAVGAALSQISGSVDHVLLMDNRVEALNLTKKKAKEKAIQAGADESSLEVVEIVETPLAYIPGNATRFRVKVVGNIRSTNQEPTSNCTEIQLQSSLLQSDKEWSIDGKSNRYVDTTSVNKNIVPKIETLEVCTKLEPNINKQTGEWILNEHDVKCICIGTGILGCGGGGSPYLARIRALQQLKSGKTMRVINPQRLGSSSDLDGHVAIVAFMGAPTVIIEKLISGSEYRDAIQIVQQTSGKKIVAVMPAEIGGMNGLEPLVAAAEMNLPALDCDIMGRAFPMLQMTVSAINGHPYCPAVLVDEKGTKVSVLDCDSPKHLEDILRSCIMNMGCSAALCINPFNKDSISGKTVPYTVSQAWHIGSIVIEAQRDHKKPLLELEKQLGATILIQGKIMDVNRKTTAGFAVGTILIDGLGEWNGKQISIDLQNENLIAYSLDGQISTGTNKTVLATVPDLISIIDSDIGEAITTEELRYGLRVAVIVLKAPPCLCTEQALEVVGPRAFGYDQDYVPIQGDYKLVGSICPL